MQPDWQHPINTALGKTYQWQAFAEGSSNALYCGCLENECILVRINGAAEDAIGVVREREKKLLDLIAPHVWAPHIIENRVEEGWCAMTCYAPFSGKILSTEQRQQLIQAVSDLQRIPITDYSVDKEWGNRHGSAMDFNAGKPHLLTIDYNRLWEDTYLPIAMKRNNPQAVSWIEETQQRLLDLPNLPASLVHHDLHIGNLALNHHNVGNHATTNRTKTVSQLILLDWEYGGIGNAWFDAAALKRFFEIDSDIIFSLPVFDGFALDKFEDGLSQAILLSEVLDKLWYWARE